MDLALGVLGRNKAVSGCQAKTGSLQKQGVPVQGLVIGRAKAKVSLVGRTYTQEAKGLMFIGLC